MNDVKEIFLAIFFLSLLALFCSAAIYFYNDASYIEESPEALELRLAREHELKLARIGCEFIKIRNENEQEK